LLVSCWSADAVSFYVRIDISGLIITCFGFLGDLFKNYFMLLAQQAPIDRSG